jgi:hypothetical protein
MKLTPVSYGSIGSKSEVGLSVRKVTFRPQEKQGRQRSMAPTALPAPDIEIG